MIRRPECLPTVHELALRVGVEPVCVAEAATRLNVDLIQSSDGKRLPIVSVLRVVDDLIQRGELVAKGRVPTLDVKPLLDAMRTDIRAVYGVVADMLKVIVEAASTPKE